MSLTVPDRVRLVLSTITEKLWDQVILEPTPFAKLRVNSAAAKNPSPAPSEILRRFTPQNDNPAEFMRLHLDFFVTCFNSELNDSRTERL